MMIRTNRLSLILLATLILLGCEKEPESTQTIALVGERSEIDFNELHSYVKNRVYDLRYKDPMQAHLTALDVLVHNQLKRIDFFAQGFHLREDLMLPARRTISEELMIGYFQKEFLGTYLSEENIAEMYALMGKEVLYRQIVVRKPIPGPPAASEAVLARVQDIRKRLDAGETFESLVSKYSEDAGSSGSGGNVDPVNWATNFNDPVSFAAFRMSEGEVQTIETPNSYHIIHITRIIKVDVRPLEDVRNEILKQLDAMYVDRSLAEYDAYRESIIDSVSLKWNEPAISKILEWSKERRFFAESYRSTFQKEIEAGNNLTLLTWNGNQTVDLLRYQYLMDHVLAMAPAAVYLRSEIKNHILEALINDHLVQKAKELNLESEILHPDTKNPVLRDQIVRIYNDHVIRSRIPEPNPANLLAYYETVKDSTFHQLHTVTTYVIRVDDPSHANELLQRFRSGTPFNSLAHEKLVRNFYRDRDGELKTLNNTPQPDLAKAAFAMALNEVAGPFTYLDPNLGTQSAILQVVDILEEKPLSFDEVQPRILPLYQRYHYHNVEKEVVDQLRTKYPVKINKPLLEKKLRENGLM